MSDPALPQSALPPAGLIDLHSHLLPGIDDGCETFADSLACVRRLMRAGFVGTICTPHVWPELFPNNTTHTIADLTVALQARLEQEGLTYRIWPGGEVRLFKGLKSWARDNPLPTLAHTRCVLVDFWDDAWPRWVGDLFDWMLAEGYQPILAHPERLRDVRDLDEKLRSLAAQGVWLQGNTRCMTGEEGYQASQIVRALLGQNRYRFLALDMHRPDSLESRLDGLELVRVEFGDAAAARLLQAAPRQLLGLEGA